MSTDPQIPTTAPSAAPSGAVLTRYLLVFGVITAIGGIQGGMVSGMKSLIPGLVCAALLIAGALLLNSRRQLGLILSTLGTLGIGGKFVTDCVKALTSGSFDFAYLLWPKLTLAVLSLVALALLIPAFFKKSA
jgi:uncharacterized membrane protein (UPF0136 family)